MQSSTGIAGGLATRKRRMSQDRSRDRSKGICIIYAFVAAALYALSTPSSKVLLKDVPPTMMAAFLYLGAALGIVLLKLAGVSKPRKSEKLSRQDLPYTIGMVVLDIAAPILLMVGLTRTTASSASLLNNFEIVATSLIAMTIFGEAISKRMWLGIALITVSSIILSCGDWHTLSFSWGSILVLLATICWGLENNCTRMISSKDTYEIVFIKGLFSGLGSLAIAFLCGEKIPGAGLLACILALGILAYGLSIFFYIRAQSGIGAARTSAYYAVAPFVGALLSHVFLGESLSGQYLVALVIMIAGTVVVIRDTLGKD